MDRFKQNLGPTETEGELTSALAMIPTREQCGFGKQGYCSYLNTLLNQQSAVK